MGCLEDGGLQENESRLEKDYPTIDEGDDVVVLQSVGHPWI